MSLVLNTTTALDSTKVAGSKASPFNKVGAQSPIQNVNMVAGATLDTGNEIDKSFAKSENFMQNVNKPSARKLEVLQSLTAGDLKAIGEKGVKEMLGITWLSQFTPAGKEYSEQAKKIMDKINS